MGSSGDPPSGADPLAQMIFTAEETLEPPGNHQSHGTPRDEAVSDRDTPTRSDPPSTGEGDLDTQPLMHGEGLPDLSHLSEEQVAAELAFWAEIDPEIAAQLSQPLSGELETEIAEHQRTVDISGRTRTSDDVPDFRREATQDEAKPTSVATRLLEQPAPPPETIGASARPARRSSSHRVSEEPLSRSTLIELEVLAHHRQVLLEGAANRQSTTDDDTRLLGHPPERRDGSDEVWLSLVQPLPQHVLPSEPTLCGLVQDANAEREASQLGFSGVHFVTPSNEQGPESPEGFEGMLQSLGLDGETAADVLMAVEGRMPEEQQAQLASLLEEMGVATEVRSAIEEQATREHRDPFAFLEGRKRSERGTGALDTPLPKATLPDAADIDGSMSDLMSGGQPARAFTYQERELPARRTRSMFDLSQRAPVSETARWAICAICGARVTDEWIACPSCNTRLYFPPKDG